MSDLGSFIIEVCERGDLGSAACRRLRKKGMLPVAVYHKGDDSLNCVVIEKDFRQLAKKATSSQIFTIKSKVNGLDGKLFLVKQIQRDPVKGELLHADFYTLKSDEEVTVSVVVEIEGEAKGVKVDGGVLAVPTRSILVSCFPANIPEKIVINVSKLGVGDSIFARDIELPSGVELGCDPDEPVVSVTSSRATAEEGDSPESEKKESEKK